MREVNEVKGFIFITLDKFVKVKKNSVSRVNLRIYQRFLRKKEKITRGNSQMIGRLMGHEEEFYEGREKNWGD